MWENSHVCDSKIFPSSSYKVVCKFVARVGVRENALFRWFDLVIEWKSHLVGENILVTCSMSSALYVRMKFEGKIFFTNVRKLLLFVILNEIFTKKKKEKGKNI